MRAIESLMGPRVISKSDLWFMQNSQNKYTELSQEATKIYEKV